ncbi:NifB/NifX family molybdenum-iron cluster-binding protein [Sediminispirochaeta bajacaliforniensis]|uniref:NifB/NifX family molybdenum-iron cluster-binding protein n=1 Tax=Sediminispirochaeta bajacaliforniensis TaxID=148 RepID=UPI000369EBFE|nr:NifB/NifX family molybdenum-iron cluster-binding protein [Sediminispirochaeta bajacaliforniensis]
MKIALPASESGEIESHFGHCSGFVVFTIENGAIAAEERIIPPPGCGCKSTIIPDLVHAGVTIMIAGNMGPGAAMLIGDNGIDLYRGAEGNAREAVEAFLAGRLSDHDVGCGDHGHDHECSHH